jgi:hypothetical protein
MLPQLAIGTGLKVGLGALGSAISAGYGALSGAARGIGALSSTLTSASQDLEKESKKKRQDDLPPNVIIGNFGMAGSAGKQKVTGSGTLPPLKNIQKPRVSEKMPTEALMDTAVKYLTSIDKSLKAQLEFERRAYEQQTRDQREAIIEEKKSFNFSDIKDRLSGFKSSTQDAAGTLATLAKYAAGLGIAAALVASALDDSELERLRNNIDRFSEMMKPLSDLANMIPAGGFAGFLVGLLFGKGIKGRFLSGVKGGLLGILSTAVADVVLSRITGGEVSEDTKSILNVGAAAGIGYLGYRGVKSGISAYRGIQAARTTMATQRAGASYYDPEQGRMRSNAAGTRGRFTDTKGATGFLKSPRWQRFLDWLTKKGKRRLVTKITQRIAIAGTTAAVTATGVGAAFGAIGFLLNLGFSLFLMYEIYQLWQEWTSVEEAEQAGVGDADIAREINQPDATAVAGPSLAADRVVSRSETGRPEEAQAFFESKGWSPEQAAGIVGNLVVESGLRTDIVGDGGRAYGIAQWHPDRQAKFREVYGKDIRQSNFQEQLEFVNWELNNSEAAAGRRLRGATSAQDAAAIVDQYYERSAGIHRQQRMANASSIMAGDFSNLQGGGGGGSSGEAGSVAGRVASAGLDTVAKLFGTLGSAIIKPGVARTDLMGSTSNAPERISNESMNIQNDIALGINRTRTQEAVSTPATPGVSPGVPQPLKSISSMDPNYQSLNILTHYLGHFTRPGVTG